MFKTAATRIAHNSTLSSLAVGGNKDLKPLQDMITAEKAVLVSLQKLSVDFAKASEALKAWGSGEGDDLGDITNASNSILSGFSAALTGFAGHEHTIRDTMKAVRTREENLDELKRRRKNLLGKADAAEKKLSKMSPEHKQLTMQTSLLYKLREDIRAMDSEIMTEEAALSDFKRQSAREWMGTKFGGLLECCEKGTIAAEYGKLITGEIPQEVTQPGMPRSMYQGHLKIDSLNNEAQRCISEVGFSTVSSSAPHAPRSFNPPNDYNNNTNSVPTSPTGGQWAPPAGPPPGHNEPPTMGGAPNYQLSTPQGLGMGHFLDTSVTSNGSNSAPGTPIQQTPVQQRGQNIPPYPQIESYPQVDSYPQVEPYPKDDAAPPPPELNTMDDFGVVPSASDAPGSTFSGPFDTSGTAGGRFATFPVKNRERYTLRDDGPLNSPNSESALRPRHEAEQSFSSSIAEALGSPIDLPDNGNAAASHSQKPSYGSPGELMRSSIDDPAPSYASHTPTYHPPSGPPPGAYNGPPGSFGSPPSSYIPPPGAYNAPPGTYDSPQQGGYNHADTAPPMNAEPTWDYPNHNGGNRAPSPNEEDLQLAYMGVEEEAPQPWDSQSRDNQPRDEGPRHVRFGEVSDVEEELEHRRAEQHGATNGRSEVPLSPEEEERNLNAAAAREVSRELDALTFNPPAPSPNVNISSPGSPERGGAPNSTSPYAYGGSPPSIHREPSPLVPPSAPFRNRSVSPHPSFDSSSSPYPSPSTMHKNTSSYSSQNSTTYARPPPSSEPSSPVDTRPNHSQLGPAINLPDVSSPLSMGGNSPYRTPPEYPRTLGPSPFSKSSSSVNSTGPRTISAAAFKRPPARMASAGGDGVADTSPLSFKKRLPSSPYPQGGAGGSPLPPIPASSLSKGEDYFPERPRAGSTASTSNGPANQGQERNQPLLPPVTSVSGGEDESYDYISAYVNSDPVDDTGSPMQADYGRLGGPKVVNDHGMSPNTPNSGYSGGKFSTDLEGSLR